MVSTNRAPQHGFPALEATVVAKSLDDFSNKERQKITSELKRIHKIVSAYDSEPLRDTESNKADRR